MSYFRRALAAFAGLVCLARGAYATDLLHGIGAMGDSATDEYQFYSSDPGDRHLARNWVEILAATRGLNFGAFTTADQGSPRFQGYEYNWARTRSTAAANFNLGLEVDFQPLTTLGQQTGLAGQVSTGQVTLTAMLIGNNDFLQYFVDPTLPPPTPASLNTQVGNMTANALTAASTVLAASPDVKMVIFTIPDEKWSPAAQAATNGAIAAHLVTQAQVDLLYAGLSAATNGYNAQLEAFAAAHPGQVAIADLHAALDNLENAARDPINPQPYVVNGITMDLDTPGHAANSFWLDDGIHPSTIAQGILANLFIDTIDANWNAGVTDLSASEITSFAAASVPEPASLGLLACGLVVLAKRRK